MNATRVRDRGPLAIVLGGTHAHVPLIERLHGRGYRVLLADHLDDPPARRVADEHVRVSTLAVDDVVALASERRAGLVIATSVDRANVTAARVAERLGLPAPYAASTAEHIADKLAMKVEMRKLGIPTADFVAVRKATSLEPFPLRFPVVVKPIDTGGSKGVRKVTDPALLDAAVRGAFEATRADDVLIESFVEGVEVSADCLVHDGEAHVLLLRRKYVSSIRRGAVLCNFASVAPAAIPAAAEARLRRTARDIARGFGLRSTPLLVQFIVDGDDVRVIEFAPRIGGGTNHRQVVLRTGVDIVSAALDSYLGQLAKPSIVFKPGCSATGHVYAEPGRFGEVRNHQAVLDERLVSEIYVHKAHGAVVGPSMAASDRVASFIVEGNDIEELFDRIRRAMQRLDVVDVAGRSIMRREMPREAP